MRGKGVWLKDDVPEDNVMDWPVNFYDGIQTEGDDRHGGKGVSPKSRRKGGQDAGEGPLNHPDFCLNTKKGISLYHHEMPFLLSRKMLKLLKLL